MKHDPYSLTELIRNDDFIAWVRKPDEKNEVRWRQFLQNNPRKKETVESARRYIIFMGEDTGKSQPTSEQSEKMWKAVERHLRGEDEGKDEEIVEEEAEPEPGKALSGWRWARIAASTMLIAGMTSFGYWQYVNQAGHEHNQGLHVSGLTEHFVEKNNMTGKPMLVLLPDGSSVMLEPESSLRYEKTAKAETREVVLTGKAFFEIVKDVKRPFLVYAFGLVTKVLGTSFLIDAPEDGKEIKVAVKTGKVSVFSIDELSDEDNKVKSQELKGFMLNPTEEVAFARQAGTFTKLVPKPTVSEDGGAIANQVFVFDETPVSRVFEAIENAYHVKILYNQEKLGRFPLNATLTGTPLQGKLEVICHALDAEFEISGNQIAVTLASDHERK